NNGLGEVCEAHIGVLIMDVLGELGNALGIRLGLEPEALALEQSLQLLVVGDNAIVDNGELPVGVGPVPEAAALAARHRENKGPKFALRQLSYLWGWQLRRDGGP